ncbi:MAG: DinB family protein [Acidobacteriales bacterium]|nr:DinB family protein [Terriglobales bacterium]
MKSPLVSSLEQVLEQGLSLLEHLGDRDYAMRLAVPYNASIGAHYRHIVDHLLCLQGGLHAGRVDYDLRGRDPRVEIERDYARSVTRGLRDSFRSLTVKDCDRTLAVSYSVGYDLNRTEWLASTVGRELAFCTGHAIHHFAIIRILCSQLEVAVPEHFGVAPSTLKFLQTTPTN